MAGLLGLLAAMVWWDGKAWSMSAVVHERMKDDSTRIDVSYARARFLAIMTNLARSGSSLLFVFIVSEFTYKLQV